MKNNIYLILLVLNLVVSITLGVMIIYYQESNTCESNIIYNEPLNEKTNSSENIQVEIKGNVANPGVYSLKSGSIINDLIEASGGLKKNSYTNNINLSKKLKNEMVIYVYTKYEYSLLNKESTPKEEIKECICPSIEVSTCLNKGESIIVNNDNSYYIKEKNVDNKLININTASKEELTSLSGIGDAKADSIIKYRNENGFFNSIEDLIKVSGISQNIYDKIKDSITV